MTKKEKPCDRDDPDDDRCGDCWDYVALDPEHRLVVSALVGRHSAGHVDLLVEDFHRRTEGRLMNLMTSDENPAYAEAILAQYGEEYQPRRKGKRGRRPARRKRPPKGLKDATVHKTREKNRVVAVEQRVIFGTAAAVVAALAASRVSATVNTVFVERENGTDRNRNARKVRKTYCFSKDWDVHEAVSYFTLYSYNFCWPVRTLRQGSRRKGYRQRTPAMAAGLTDHIWTLNASERALRQVVLGRANWQFCGSAEGGRTAATLYSVVGTCKHLGIDPFGYLREALPGLFALGKEPAAEQLLGWVPDRWLPRLGGDSPRGGEARG